MEKTTPLHIEMNIATKYQNGWCLVVFRKNCEDGDPLPYLLSIHHRDSQEWEETLYLQSIYPWNKTWLMGIVYIPALSDKIGVSSLRENEILNNKSRIKIVKLSRSLAAILLTSLNPKKNFRATIGSPANIKKRLRAALSQSCFTYPKILTYNIWCQFYDRWSEDEKEKLYNSLFYKAWPTIIMERYNNALVPTIFTTEESNLYWSIPTDRKVTYVAIVQNNETLPPHALAVFADQAARHQYPEAMYADSAMVNANDEKSEPIFKSDIGYLTLLSGILTQDIWLIRKDIFDAYQLTNPQTFKHAHIHRLAIALYICEKKYSILHIPFILSYRKERLTISEIKDLQYIVRVELSKQDWQSTIVPDLFPMKIKLFAEKQKISLIIPTTISSTIIQKSIKAILKKTDYSSFEVILVISQPVPFNEAQENLLSPLKKFPNLKILWLETNKFNFSESCNFGIKHSTYDFVGIVNDDIRPINSNWLKYMMGHMQDPQVGAVGAKLYYPNNAIQHAGIVMGAANLCEHVGRFRKSHRNDFILSYDHDVSAVTGACMIIRMSAFKQVGGFDTGYEIAYNDIDFCLKLRKANYRIIQCQNAELTHYESLSLGNHYTGERAGKERQEILSIRAKWKDTCNNDPFYNPNLSLQRGMDYKLSFPPRICRPFADPNLMNE